MPDNKAIKGRPPLAGYMERTMPGSKSSPNTPSPIRRLSPISSSAPENTYLCKAVFENKPTPTINLPNCTKESSVNNPADVVNDNGYSCKKPLLLKSQQKDKLKNKPHTTVTSTGKRNYFISFVSCLVVIISIYPYFFSNETKSSQGYKNYVFDIQNTFPSQGKKVWSIIISGLHNVIDSDGQNTVFLLLNSESQDKTVNKLSNEIAAIASKKLGSENPIVLTEKDILSLPNEEGYFIHKYEKDLQEKKVLLIHNLHKIPSVVAKSFHFICDNDYPLVKKSIIIFTMDMPKVPDPDSLVEVTEDTLQKLWSPPLHDNIISPLITRLTSNIVPVVPESIYYK